MSGIPPAFTTGVSMFIVLLDAWIFRAFLKLSWYFCELRINLNLNVWQTRIVNVAMRASRR